LNPTDFASLGLVEPVLSAVRDEGYVTPTPIQAESIPALLAGRDLLGIAQTGTGKTAAFALPLIQRLLADPRKSPPKATRVLVVAPTRELAAQIDESFAVYGKGANLSRACIFGGVGSLPQEKILLRGVDVLVATPGRLLDLIDRKHLTLSFVEAVVLDEADRMFDMGFIRDVRRIVALLPSERQTIFFSATMPPEIEAFADPLLRDPVRAAVPSAQPTADRVDQKVLFVAKDDKRKLLAAILKEDGFKRVIVFTKTKHGANRLVKQLAADGVTADAIHANKSQNARTRTMDAFRSGGVDVLVATDLAARGIDVDEVELIVNFDLPNEPETYIHRIGRTARAGAEGVAVSFCDADERTLLRDIERLVGFRIPVELDHPFRLDIEPIREPERPQGRKPRPTARPFDREREGRPIEAVERAARARSIPSRAPSGERRGYMGDRPPVDRQFGDRGGFRRDGRVEQRGPVRGPSRGPSSREPSRGPAPFGREPSIADLFAGRASLGPTSPQRNEERRPERPERSDRPPMGREGSPRPHAGQGRPLSGRPRGGNPLPAVQERSGRDRPMQVRQSGAPESLPAAGPAAGGPALPPREGERSGRRRRSRRGRGQGTKIAPSPPELK